MTSSPANGNTVSGNTVSGAANGAPNAGSRVASKESRGSKRRRIEECPFLSTVNRNLLDFDFEKVCSVTLSDQNIYCCLCCGKYYQGRGKGTQAHRHALEVGHYVFMKLDSSQIYCLPDDYEVMDASLNDIKYNLHPTYTEEEVKAISAGTSIAHAHAKSLDGVDFVPGCLGLNNIKNSDYLNTIVQLLCVIAPLRNFFLSYQQQVQKPQPVVTALSELMRKIHSAQNFKGIVSPHEFFQAVGKASKKKFYGEQHDPVSFFSWLMSHLSKRLTKEFDVLGVFEGEVSVRATPVTKHEQDIQVWTESKHKTLVFQLDLPPEPLFKDDYDFIPQVPLFTLLEKYNGETAHESIAKSGEGREIKRYALRRLPPYCVFQMKRFKHNNFFKEKNITLVNFPLADLDLAPYLHPDAMDANPHTKFNLVANISHSGKPNSGEYKIQVYHKASAQWYEIQDLRVSPVMRQAVGLTEAYMLVYERCDVGSDGGFETFKDIIIPETEGVVEEDDVDLAAIGIDIS